MEICQKEQAMIMGWVRSYAPFKPEDNEKRAWGSIDTILHEWKDQKSKYLSKLFGGQLILEREVSVPLTLNDLQKEYYEKIENYELENSVAHDFILWFRSDCYYAIVDLNKDDRQSLGAIRFLHNVNNILENKFDQWDARWLRSYGCRKINLPNDKTLTIDENTRPLRAIGKIAAAFGKSKEFEAYRIAVSQVTNLKYLKGTLCLSIHPMDYMTMSDNESGWRSCMNWRGYGEFRSGTVEMMNSPLVVVAYLKSADRTLPNGWNSKKWRTLAIVTKDIITTIKSYPYYKHDLDQEVVTWLTELADTNLGWNDYDEATSYDPEYSERVSFWTGAMYNDMNNGAEPFGCFAPALDGQEIYYSGRRTCMCCGCTMDVIDDEESLLCYDCENED